MQTDFAPSVETPDSTLPQFLLRLTDARGQSEHRVAHTDALGACLAFFMSGPGRAFVARHGVSPQLLFDTLPAEFERRARVEGSGFALDIERVQ
jgi:hypothetical protein